MTLAVTTIETLTTTLSLENYGTNFVSTSTPTFYFIIDTVFLLQPLANMAQLDNSLWCPDSVSVTFPATNPFDPAITYEIGTA